MGGAPGGYRGHQGKPSGPGGMRPNNRGYQGNQNMQQRGAPMHGGQMNQQPMGQNMQMNPAASSQMNQQQ